jgi:hypothetical protein
MEAHRFARHPRLVPCRRVKLAPLAACLGLVALLSSARDAAAGSESEGEGAYGLFGWLDHRSAYGKEAFPEPFLIDPTDLEENEARLDWLRTARGSSHDNLFTGEVAKSFGIVTVEADIPFERIFRGGRLSEGANDIFLQARAPVWQYVSPGGAFDTTVGVLLEAGIPTHSTLSKNPEFAPKAFDDLKIGNLTMQSVLGYSMLTGPGPDGGTNTFQYGFTFGYTLAHETLPVPGTEQIVPIVELSCGTPLNKADSGRTTALTNLGFRANLAAIGHIEPRFGFGIVLPLNSGARDDSHWGVVTSFVFDY